MQPDLLSITLRFIKAIEDGNTGADLSEFYHHEIEQTEYPNALTKTLTTRNLHDLKEASEKGKKILVKQTYDVKNSYVSGNTVIIECVWTGTLAVPLGKIPAGGNMVAWFTQIYEYREGKIFRQRNYDCFEPFI